MTKTPKFTKREQAKLMTVFNKLRAKLNAEQNVSQSRYNNNFGCGTCGDTGPFHGLLFRLEQEVGLRKKEE